MPKSYLEYLDIVNEETYNFTANSDDTMFISQKKPIPAQVFQAILQDSLNLAKQHKMKMRGKPGVEALIDLPDDRDGSMETLDVSQATFRDMDFVKAHGEGVDFMNAWASMIKKNMANT